MLQIPNPIEQTRARTHRVAWGRGKREVLALKAEIMAFLETGATLGEAHRHFTESGRLTLGYTAFTIHVKAARMEAAAALKAMSPASLLAAVAAAKTTSAPVLPTGHLTPTSSHSSIASMEQQQPAPAGGHSIPAPAVSSSIPKYQPFKSGEKDHW